MARQTGITADTPQRLIVDAGVLYLDYGEVTEEVLGATRGGSVFSVETEQKSMEFDGAIGPLKGAQRIVGVSAKLTVNMVEFTTTIFNMAFPGSSSSDYGSPKSHDLITRAGVIALADYYTNVTLVANTTVGSTSYAMFMLKNAIADSNLEMTFADKDESVPSITFMAHFDPTDLDTEPWEIYWPVES